MNAFEASPLIPHGFVSCVVLSLEAAANSCCFYLSIAPGFGHSGSEVQGDNFIFEVLKHGLINLYSTVDGSSRAPCDGFVFRSASGVRRLWPWPCLIVFNGSLEAG